jgi:hypothetical protein
MTAISDLSAVKAVGAGTHFVTIAIKQWVFTLSAIGVISEAGLGGAANIGLYLFYVLATQTFVLTPILACDVAPQAGAAQSSDSNSCVTGFWGVVPIQGRQRIDRLTLAMSPAKREMT